MIAPAIAIAALVALALLWRYRARRRYLHGAWERKRRSDSYHCVELRFRGDACDAVKRIEAKRFLPDDAPQFPLPGCDAPKCSCRYVHHEDRRDGDRRNPFGQHASEPPASADAKRRSKTDRRKPSETPFRPTITR
jgi:hypothetical protein